MADSVQAYGLDEEFLRKNMEKDIKCIEKFSEKTIISPNAFFYKP